MYSECWAGPTESEAISTKSLIPLPERGMAIRQMHVDSSAWAGAPATTSATFRPAEKTSPQTLPRAWSQLLPPRREATKIHAFLRLAGCTLSRTPQVVPRYALTVKIVPGDPVRATCTQRSGEGLLSPTFTAPSIHGFCQRGSRAKSFF